MFAFLDLIAKRSDPFNHKGYRNGKNTSTFGYNCGGFALGTYSWYCPSYNDYCWGDELDEWEMADLLEECVNKMLEDFPDLRVIEDLCEVENDEYVILFRLSSDGDFHYVVQGTGRLWWHKPGNQKVRSIPRDYALDEYTAWGGRYDSETIILAKKKNRG